MNEILERVTQHLHGILSARGFQRKRLNWRRRLPDLIQVVNLQKSTYSVRYMLDFGLCIAATCTKAFPGQSDHNVDWPLAMLLPPEERPQWTEAEDFENSLGITERLNEFERIIRSYVLPVFEATETIESLRAVLNNPRHQFFTPYRAFLQLDGLISLAP